jgi:hypothetical protein
MSVEFSSVKSSNIRVEEGTPGGRTYYVVLPGRDAYEHNICFRRMHKAPTMRCTNKAGQGTVHVGSGPCKFHGGNNTPHGIVTGRNAKITRLRLKDSIESYLNTDRASLLDLNYELACAKAIFDEFMSVSPDPRADEYGIFLNRFLTIISSMSNLVDRMSRVENRNTLTAAQVLYLRATVADILMKYVPDPFERERAAKELASRMGGDMAVQMQPSEIRMLEDADSDL